MCDTCACCARSASSATSDSRTRTGSSGMKFTVGGSRYDAAASSSGGPPESTRAALCVARAVRAPTKRDVPASVEQLADTGGSALGAAGGAATVCWRGPDRSAAHRRPSLAHFAMMSSSPTPPTPLPCSLASRHSEAVASPRADRMRRSIAHADCARAVRAAATPCCSAGALPSPGATSDTDCRETHVAARWGAAVAVTSFTLPVFARGGAAAFRGGGGAGAHPPRFGGPCGACHFPFLLPWGPAATPAGTAADFLDEGSGSARTFSRTVFCFFSGSFASCVGRSRKCFRTDAGGAAAEPRAVATASSRPWAC